MRRLVCIALDASISKPRRRQVVPPIRASRVSQMSKTRRYAYLFNSGSLHCFYVNEVSRISVGRFVSLSFFLCLSCYMLAPYSLFRCLFLALLECIMEP